MKIFIPLLSLVVLSIHIESCLLTPFEETEDKSSNLSLSGKIKEDPLCVLKFNDLTVNQCLVLLKKIGFQLKEETSPVREKHLEGDTSKEAIITYFLATGPDDKPVLKDNVLGKTLNRKRFPVLRRQE